MEMHLTPTMLRSALLLLSRLTLASIVLFGLAATPAAASTFLYTWDFATMQTALASADYGGTLDWATDPPTPSPNCTGLADCAVVSLYLTPQLPAGTVNILGAFGPDTWATSIDGSDVHFAPADQSTDGPVRFITTAGNIGGSFTYGELISNVVGPVSHSRFGIFVSFLDDTAPLPESFQWDGWATVVGLNGAGDQRLFGDIGKDVSADFPLDSEYYAAVPEPGTLLLSGLGLAAILPIVLKRRRQA
jgi:hypothetical protein